MSAVNGWTVTGALVLLAIPALILTGVLIDRGRDRDRRNTFDTDTPSWHWYSQLKKARLPESAPFPGDEPAYLPSGPQYNPVTLISTRPDGPDPTGPLVSFEVPPDSSAPDAFLPAPATAAKPAYVVDEIGHDGDTEAWLISAWDHIQAGELQKRLEAEEAEEALS